MCKNCRWQIWLHQKGGHKGPCIPPLNGELKTGGGGGEEVGDRSMPLRNLPLIMHLGANKCCFDTHIKKNLYRGRGTAPSPAPVTLLLHFPPVDKYTTVTLLDTGHKDPCPPFPRWSESKTFEGGGGGVGNLLVYIRNLTYPKQGRDPSAARSLRSLTVILFMFAPYTSRYHSLRNIHFPKCIFFLLCFTDNFPQKNPPKVSSFNFNCSNIAKIPAYLEQEFIRTQK